MKLKVLFLGPWAMTSVVNNVGESWVKRLASHLEVGAGCTVLDPPVLSEDSLDSKGYWMRPVARKPEDRVRILRKHIFTGLVTLLNGVVRWGPHVVMGYGQGGLIVALASMPLVLESACRARVVTPDEMRNYRVSWARVKALVAVNPCLTALQNDIQLVRQAIPELSKQQPTGVYREVLLSAKRTEAQFAKLAAIVAAPVNNEKFETELLRQALSRPTPVYVEDETHGVGGCCVCLC